MLFLCGDDFRLSDLFLRGIINIEFPLLVLILLYVALTLLLFLYRLTLAFISLFLLSFIHSDYVFASSPKDIDHLGDTVEPVPHKINR